MYWYTRARARTRVRAWTTTYELDNTVGEEGEEGKGGRRVEGEEKRGERRRRGGAQEGETKREE